MRHANTLEFLREAAYTMYREPGEFPDVCIQIGQRFLHCMVVVGPGIRAGRVAWIIDGRLANERRAKDFLGIPRS